ncbi:UNVERIFIED_CONTAM: hypothetical protein K2H54_029161, partial [Gekko kuhli]
SVVEDALGDGEGKKKETFGPLGTPGKDPRTHGHFPKHPTSSPQFRGKASISGWIGMRLTWR